MLGTVRFEQGRTMDIRIRVDMVPKGKASPRAVLAHGGKHAMIHKDEKTRKWENDFAIQASNQMPAQQITCPVRVDILAVFPRTKPMLKIFVKTGAPKYPTGLIPFVQKPDRDNIEKSVQDALKVHWTDDKLVTWGETIKAYVELDGKPRVVVRIRSVANDHGLEADFSLANFQNAAAGIEGLDMNAVERPRAPKNLPLEI
jgi:Holliday junction resolvase RusA-like endonuclease